MRFLIAGLGSIGRRHLRNLQALGESDIVLYRTGRSTLPEEDLTGLAQESDLQRALSVHQPDAVIVANPTALHLDVAIPAAEAGCAILLEKPISHSLDRLDLLENAAARSGSRILMGFQFRFHPSLARAKELIAAGNIGRVISAHVHFGEYLPGWHPWEDYRLSYAARADLGGGVVLTQSHALDYLPWLIGQVADVWALTGRLAELGLDVDDSAEIGLRFADGALGNVHLDFVQKPPVHELAVVGTQGVLRAGLLGEALVVHSHDTDEPRSWPLPAGWERNRMFLDEMRHFIDVAGGKAEPSCGLRDGICAQRLIDAIYRSDRGRTVTRP